MINQWHNAIIPVDLHLPLCLFCCLNHFHYVFSIFWAMSHPNVVTNILARCGKQSLFIWQELETVILWSDSNYTACNEGRDTLFPPLLKNQLHLRMCFIGQMDKNSPDSLTRSTPWPSFPPKQFLFFKWVKCNEIKYLNAAFLQLLYISLCCKASKMSAGWGSGVVGSTPCNLLCKLWYCGMRPS